MYRWHCTKENDCCQSDTDLTSVFQVQAKMVVTTHDVCMAGHLSAHSTEVLSHAHLASSCGKLWTKFSLFWSGVPPAGDWNPHGFICHQDLLIIENSYRWPYICWKTHFTKNSQKRQKEEKNKKRKNTQKNKNDEVCFSIHILCPVAIKA